LTRLLPYIFEEPEWRGFFWSDIPVNQSTTSNEVWRKKNEKQIRKNELILFRNMSINHH